jgi:hypothetical protein
MSQEQTSINDIQRLHFELFQRVRYNLLDGASVVSDLLDLRDLWYSVIPNHLPYPIKSENNLHPNLGMLRTTRWDSWPADTLYIWTNDQKVTHLQQLIEERWQASEVKVLLPDTDEINLCQLVR